MNRLGIVSGMIGLLKNLGSMTGVTVTSLVSTVTQVAVLNQLNASGVFGAAAERESFASAVRVTFLVSAAVFFVVIITSIIRGKEAPTTKPLAVEVENA